jgi:hypothetical protein
MRIDIYITTEFFRPKLSEAIENLDKGREVLGKNADKWIIWPNMEKYAALARYDELVEKLKVYLEKLGDYSGPSAVGLTDLYNIKSDIYAGKQDPFKQRVRSLLNLNKTTLMQITNECAKVAATLRTAFHP